MCIRDRIIVDHFIIELYVKFSFSVTNFPSTKLQLGVEITYIALNRDETFLAVAYKNGNTLYFGLIDVKILEDQV